MGNGLLAFAAGLGSGYLNGQQRQEEQKRIDEDRGMRKQEFDARMDAANREKESSVRLANAATPMKATEVTDIDPNNPAAPRRTSFSLSDGRSVGTREEADAAAKDYNAPEATDRRIGLAMAQSGKPLQAKQYENAVTQGKRDTARFTQEQHDVARKMADEGVFDSVKALRTGNGAGFADAFNKNGNFKIEGQPEVVKENREIPGIGTVPTYTAKFNLVHPDGKVTTETRNSHDLAMQTMPYEKAIEMQRKGTDSDNKATYQSGLLDARERVLAAKEASGSGQPSREERLRYTSLFSDAGRRLSEAQKALVTLQKDPSFSRKSAKPGTPEAQQLQDLQETIKSHRDERTLYQGMLSGSQTGGLSTASKGEAGMREAASGDMGQDPAALQREIAATARDLETVTDPSSKMQLQAHLEDLKRQGKPTGLASARPMAPAGGKPSYSNLWK